jgi:hypothetical protein
MIRTGLSLSTEVYIIENVLLVKVKLCLLIIISAQCHYRPSTFLIVKLWLFKVECFNYVFFCWISDARTQNTISLWVERFLRHFLFKKYYIFIDLCKLRSYALHIWQTMVFLSFRVYSSIVIKETIVYDASFHNMSLI